ncbi:MAG: AMP-binding protein [Candidatus Tectomicrobia bacterium]|uniref:AMP-binding protein n=1 Tax=Tectimicrobiota bacterium TaxID=2528274 RepID=A0A938B3K7_UNCTE|nr:AMP-binding protein [Candidatus Tectomicrobia bacterium]
MALYDGAAGNATHTLPALHTAGALLAHLAEILPQHEAVVWPPQRVTYAALYAQARTIARGLWQLGIRRGDPVALLLSNRPEWIITALGCALLGAPVVALSTWSRRLELAYVLEHSQAVALITLDGFLGADYQALLTEVAPELKHQAPGQLNVARLPALRELMVLGQPMLPAARRFEDVMTHGNNLEDTFPQAVSAAVQPDDMLYVLYTSGSTARPKGVPLSHAGCLENGWHIGERQHLTQDDRLWLAVPLFWSFGAANALMALLTHGGTVVLQEYFEAEQAVQLIAAERCTVYYGMSHMARAMLATPSWPHADTGSLRTGLTIGTPEEVALTMHELGVRQLCNVYGATETYGNATVTDAHDPEAVRLQTQGKPLPGMRMRIVDPDSRAVLPAGEVGEICVAGYIAPGYYRDPETTAQAFDAEGYFLTGDLGMFDTAGYLHFRGRLKELIKSGGINISPLEVEAYLRTHPQVQQAAVVGLPDAVKGEIPVAAVELHAGGNVSAAALRDFCRNQLASYKIPVHIVFLEPDAWPRTSTGKIQKIALREVVAARLSSPLHSLQAER